MRTREPMEGIRTGQPNPRRDFAVAAVILVAAALLLLTGTSADGEEGAGKAARTYIDVDAVPAATIPAGRHSVAGEHEEAIAKGPSDAERRRLTRLLRKVVAEQEIGARAHPGPR